MPIDLAQTFGGFFGILQQAHARIEMRLRELEQAADGLADPVRTPRALEAMAGVLDFLATFGAQHNDDEEKTLFPTLRPLPDFAEMLGAFDFQHRMVEKEQSELAARVRGFAPGSERALRELAHRFVEVQRSHLLAEETALFPLAERKLPRRVLVALSRELRLPNG